MIVRFWGTRGSLPKSGPGTERFGGNTSCVEVRTARDTLIVVDCGSGAHALGQHILRTEKNLKRGHLLISHTHWDHIQGFPFFAPLFIPGMEWNIYGPRGIDTSLQDALSGQMQYTYFPIGLEQLGAKLHFHELVEGDFEIDDVQVRARYLNHPALTLGYRLEADGASVVYACDHEPHSRELACGEAPITGGDHDHAEFLADADLVVHDAQYTIDEYKGKIGWGHSTADYALRVCQHANVGQVALTHHDPVHVDEDILKIADDAQKRVLKPGDTMRVQPVGDRCCIDLPPRKSTSVQGHTVNTAEVPISEDQKRLIYLGGSSATRVVNLYKALGEDGLSVKVLTDQQALIKAIKEQVPSLVILEKNAPACDASAVCAMIRQHKEEDVRGLPILVIADTEDDAINDIGIDEWLLEPFSTEYLRSRVGTHLFRGLTRQKLSVG